VKAQCERSGHWSLSETTSQLLVAISHSQFIIKSTTAAVA
jgi:hypothetical protein